MGGYSEAGVRYLEPQGEPHYGVAKYLSVDPSIPCVLGIARVQGLISLSNGGSVLYLSLLGEPKVLPNHTDSL